MKIDVIRDENNPSNEYLYKIDAKTGEKILQQVPMGTSKGYAARVINLNQARGVSVAGYEQLYDPIKNKQYNVRTMSGDNLMTFRPPHSQELKTSLANAHESDPYLKRITGFYTDYVFGDEIKQRLVPLQTDTPKDRKENDKLVNEIIGKREHEKFMKYIVRVDYMSGIYDEMRKLWNQSYVFGMAAAWKAWSLQELVNIKREIRIPIHTPIKLKPVDGFYLTNIHQDIDTYDPKFFEYNNPNSNLTEVKDSEGKPVVELSLRPNTKFRGQYNMLPWERLIIVKRQNIGTTPNTSAYGISPLLPTIYISENIRRIDEKILPELNEGSYAGVGIFTVKEDSKYDIDKLAQDLSTAGTRIVLNEGVEYQDVRVDFNMTAIIDQKISLIKSEMLALGIPESIFFPGDTNRSVLELLINIWQNIDLKKERDELQKTMWNYWYKDLMQIYFPDEPLLDLLLTVKLEFKNKSFAGFIDKAAPTIEAYKVGIYNKPEAREKLDEEAFGEFEESEAFAVVLEQRKAEAVGEEQRKTQKEAPKPTAPTGGGGAGGGNGFNAGTSAKPSSSSSSGVKKTTKVTSSTSRSKGGTG